MDCLAIPRFAHRPNKDGSFDSICLTCFATVASKRNEVELARQERVHVCNPFWSHQVGEDYLSSIMNATGLPKNRVFTDAILNWWDAHALLRIGTEGRLATGIVPAVTQENYHEGNGNRLG
jgi:hypothetical protein